MTFSLGSTPRSLVKYNDKSIDAITDIAASAKDDMVLIKTITASSSDLVTFDSDIDSTYPTYLFKFINIHPSSDEQWFTVGFRDGGSAYDATKTTSKFYAYNNEGGTDAAMTYIAATDIAQGTGFQSLALTGTGNDESLSGELRLFNPSSTTFVKHFMARLQTYYSYSAGATDYTSDIYIAGYCNVTAAIDGVQFKFASGNIDAGQIKLYGLKDS